MEQLKTGFKRTIKWNKYSSEMTKQIKTNNLSYLIDPRFNKVNRLFVWSFENEDDRTSFFKVLSTKYWNKSLQCINWRKSFFDVPVKNKGEAYEKIIELSKSNDYTSGNLLDYEYFSKYYKLIAIDLSKQTELENSDLKQQIIFIGKLEDDKATVFFIIEKSEERILNFHKILWVSYKMETQKIAILFSIKSSLCDYSDGYIVVRGYVTVNAGNDTHATFKNCHHFLHTRQKLIMCLLTKKIIFTLQCICTTCLNIVIIIQIYQQVYGNLKEIMFLLIMLNSVLIILNHLNIKQLL